MVDQRVDTPAAAPVAAGRTAVGAGVLGAATVPVAGPPPNEGRTVAAWTTVAIVLVGAVVVALGVALGQAWLDWVGAVVILAGLVVGGVLRAAGFGQPKRPR